MLHKDYVEESPCSHCPEMAVVVVLREKITYGNRNVNGLEDF